MNKFIATFVIAICFVFSIGYAQDITLTESFEGLQQSGQHIPDPVIAAGPNHVIVIVNSSIGIYNKSGTQISTTSLQTWFSSVIPSGDGLPYDPKIIYDNISNRWVILALANNLPTFSQSSYLLSVSQTSNPTGLWYYYNFDATKDNGNSTSYWADFPGLGYDAQSVYLTSNQFDFQPVFKYTKIRVINKSDLYNYNNNGNPSFVDFVNLKDPNGTTVKDIKPAQQFGTSSNFYLLNTVSGGSANYVTVWEITYNNGVPQTPTSTKIVLGSTNYIAPYGASQKGSTNIVDAKDCRISDVIYRDGYLYGAFTIQRNDVNGNNIGSSIEYLKIDVSNYTTVINDIYGEDGINYFYPEIFPDEFGNVLMVFNRSSSNDYVGVAYTYRLVSDQSVHPFTWLKQGEGSYYNLVNGVNRWGDYSGIAFDPSNGNQIWIYGEYAANNNTWSTWAGAVQFNLSNVPITFTNKIGTQNAGGNFTVINVGNTDSGIPLNLLQGDYTVKTNNERFSNWNNSGITYKQNNWNSDNINYFLSYPFQANFGPNQNQNANFNSLNYAKVQVFIDGGLVQNQGNMDFQDLWYVQSDGSQQGTNYWIPVTSYYEPTSNANSTDKGIFLNQVPDPNNSNIPYYSVRVPLTQTITVNGQAHPAYFLNWGYDTSQANLQQVGTNPSGFDQKAVVFKQAGATVTANYKGHLASNNSAVTGSSSQRKFFYDNNSSTYYTVYESMGNIWFTKSTDGGSTWTAETMISDSLGNAKNPSFV